MRVCRSLRFTSPPEMKLLASNDTPFSQDLTVSIPPIVAALHDSSLHSHCPACFRPLPAAPVPCLTCSSLLYCSPRCSAADSPLHAASGECRLLRHLPSLDTADLRAALRLLHTLDCLNLLQIQQSRIGGLLGVGFAEDQIREGVAVMMQVRGSDLGAAAAALCAVMTNAVEVEVGEGPVGVAVYGPQFSWFNHSCSPNACFRFELVSQLELHQSSTELRVVPECADTDERAVDAWESWISAESLLRHGLSRFGPRIVVRSIKPIKKGEEVCITYTDLLQPKAMRHSDLWSKYHFVCCCERCSASPQTYIDYMLSVRNQDCAAELTLDQNNMEMDYEELAERLDQAITGHMSEGNPKDCCEKLEKLLCETFQDKLLQTEEPSLWKFKLHPLHYLSLNAYITLASAYRIRANNLLVSDFGKDENSEIFKMSRAAAAYSLLLAGVVHNLFLYEPSLITSVSLYVINAGESILDFVRSPLWGSTKTSNEVERCLVLCRYQYPIESFVSWEELKVASTGFVECASCITLKLWAFLGKGFPYLESIVSAVDFSWIGIGNDTSQIHECRCRAERCIEEEIRGLLQLAVHCLFYGKYLANICYGSRCYLVEHTGKLLRGLDQY